MFINCYILITEYARRCWWYGRCCTISYYNIGKRHISPSIKTVYVTYICNPTAKRPRLSATSTHAEEVMVKASTVLEGLAKPKQQDHYDHFGVTVAGEVKSLPSDYQRSELMVKIMQTIVDFKERMQSSSTITTSPLPQDFVAPRPVAQQVMPSQSPAPHDCAPLSTFSPYQPSYTELRWTTITKFCKIVKYSITKCLISN